MAWTRVEEGVSEAIRHIYAREDERELIMKQVRTT
jgi:hypothetical protein